MNVTQLFAKIKYRLIIESHFELLAHAAMGSHARVRVNFDENETGNDVFTVQIPPNSQDPKNVCETEILIDQPVFDVVGPTLRLCNYTTMGNLNLCQCKFSNFPDKTAQSLKLKLPSGSTNEPGGYLCPKLVGYTAHPERLDANSGAECSYYANIRIADTANTGFCLRYQAM